MSVKCEISMEDKISFESRQDQLRVEHEVRVECKAHVLWSSLLGCRIAASLTVTQAMPGTSASSYIFPSLEQYSRHSIFGSSIFVIYSIVETFP